MVKLVLAVLSCACLLFSCEKENNVVATPPPAVVNKPPVANAGRDTTITLPNKLWMNGSASYDPDGAIAFYLWKQFSGPYAIIHNNHSAATYVSFFSAGTYQFLLGVTDNNYVHSVDTVQVTVNEYTNPPDLIGREVVFDSLTWKYEYVSDGCCDGLYLYTPERPDLFPSIHMNVEVSVKFDTASNWMQVKPWFEIINYPYKFFFVGSSALALRIEVFPPIVALHGRKASVKIKFL